MSGAAYMKTLYWQRRAKGECVRCGKKLSADSEDVQCFGCRRYKAAWAGQKRPRKEKR